MKGDRVAAEREAQTPTPPCLLSHCALLQEDVIPPEDLAAMNQWLDEHPENAHIRSPEQMLDGRINNYHPHTDKSDERYMGDGIAERLTGTHGRADVNVMTTSWDDAPSKPTAQQDVPSNPPLHWVHVSPS